jgi:exodeoxyribonuclease V alpha subunit
VLLRFGSEVRQFAPTRLSGVETVFAMTVHKSQGSEARAVTLVLPPEESHLLTRELFYTAVTRARERVTIVGTEAALRAAVARQVQRASGLADRLNSSAAG